MSKRAEKENQTPRKAEQQPLVAVLVVWLFLTAVFLLFNLVYLPRYRQQMLAAPESFMQRARWLEKQGERARAKETLREGISLFNPPAPEPYQALASLLDDADSAREKVLTAGRSAFYQLTGTDCSAEKMTALGMLGGAALFPKHYDQALKPLSGALDISWQSFSGALGLSTPPAWGIPERALVFLLAGSAIDFSGNIGTTGVKTPVPLLVYSGGGADSRRGVHLFAGEKDLGRRERGMHIALLDAGSGALLAAACFDVWERREEGQRLFSFLTEAPEGCIGLFAVYDDGAGVVTHDLEEAFLFFGLDRCLMDERKMRVTAIRSSLAAIGVKGAVPGSALQVWSPQWYHGRRGHPVLCAAIPGGKAP